MSAQQDMRFDSVVIENDVMSHLIQAGLSGTEWSLVLVVIQQITCKGEKTIFVSLREFHELVGLDQEAIRKGLKTLRQKNILIRHEAPSFTTPARWSFNEGVSATMNNIVVSFEKNKSSTRSSPSTAAVTLAGQLRDAVRVRDHRARSARTEDLTGWARDIDLLIRIDQRSPDEIRRVIEWCQLPGRFWGPNILSGRKLREKFDTLSGQMMRETSGARYEGRNGNYRVPQILNNRAEREYVPVRELVRI